MVRTRSASRRRSSRSKYSRMRSFGIKTTSAIDRPLVDEWRGAYRQSLGLAIKGNRSRLSPSTTTNIEEQIKKLREGDGGDIITFGGSRSPLLSSRAATPLRAILEIDLPIFIPDS